MSTNSSAGKGKSPGKAKSAAAAPKKHTYVEMIQMALLTLNETGGSTRQEIWKYIEAQYPEADHKRYLVALKRLSKDETTLVQGKNRARFALERKFRSRALARIAKGLSLISIIKSKAMTDPVKKKLKAKKPKKVSAKKPKKSSAGKKGSSPARGSKAAAAKGKGKSDANKKTTKDKIKEKAKQNKKTEGSRDTKAKVAEKRKVGDKKVAAKTNANTNKGKKDAKQSKKPAVAAK